MTACQQAMTFGGGKTFQVTLGAGGGSIGYQNVSLFFGAIAPNDIFKGQAFRLIVSAPPSFDLNIQTTGVLPQNAFSSVTVQDSAGNFRTYSSASASYATGSFTVWSWNAGNPVWTAPGPIRSITFNE